MAKQIPPLYDVQVVSSGVWVLTGFQRVLSGVMHHEHASDRLCSLRPHRGLAPRAHSRLRQRTPVSYWTVPDAKPERWLAVPSAFNVTTAK